MSDKKKKKGGKSHKNANSDHKPCNQGNPETQVAAKKKERGLTSTKGAISKYFSSSAEPLPKPAIDDNFNNLTPLERVTEALKYSVLSFEYSLSPKGGLRNYIKLNISVLLLLGIPILIFVPLFTYFMSGFSNIAELFANFTFFLSQSALNILFMLIWVICIATIVFLIKKFWKKIIALLKKNNNAWDDNDWIDITPGKGK